MDNFQEALLANQRRMLLALISQTGKGMDPGNFPIPKVSPDTVSMGAFLQQEQPFVSSQNIYNFDFSQNAPRATTILNNVKFGQNDIFGQYAVQVLLGYGAKSNNRVYRHRGVTPDDESIYNGQISQSFESKTPVFNMKTKFFKTVGEDPTTFYPFGGFQFITPFRIVTGYLAKYEIQIQLPLINNLTLSEDLFLQVSLHGAISRPK